MAERLHYFNEVSTSVSFDCNDSEIDSDLDDLCPRPLTEAERAKGHVRQLQLWSDEARRRLAAKASPSSPQQLRSVFPDSSTSLCPALPTRVSADRRQSNLSERPRSAKRVSRSHSSKNLRIRVTPSSSSKSLLSDIESEASNSQSAYPRTITLPDVFVSSKGRSNPAVPLFRKPLPRTDTPKLIRPQPQQVPAPLDLPPPQFGPSSASIVRPIPRYPPQSSEAIPQRISRTQSFSIRVKRFSLRRFMRRTGAI